MRAWGSRCPWKEIFRGKKNLNKKAKQAARSKAKQGTEAKMNKGSKNQVWPVEVEPGTVVLHVEYGEDEGIFPKPGNAEVVKFYRALQTRFGHKVRILANYGKALKELSPTKAWRPHSFEVVDLGGNKQLYSKLSTGVSLVKDEAWMSRWMDVMAEKCGLS